MIRTGDPMTDTKVERVVKKVLTVYRVRRTCDHPGCRRCWPWRGCPLPGLACCRSRIARAIDTWASIWPDCWWGGQSRAGANRWTVIYSKNLSGKWSQRDYEYWFKNWASLIQMFLNWPLWIAYVAPFCHYIFKQEIIKTTLQENDRKTNF